MPPHSVTFSHPSPAAPEGNFAKQLYRRLSNSKFFTVSVLIHGVLLAMLGTIVLVRPPDAPLAEFSSPGADIIGNEVEQPSAPTQETASPQVEAPVMPTTPVTTSTIDAITTMAPSAFAPPVPVGMVGTVGDIQPVLPTKSSGGRGGGSGLPGLGTRASSTKLFNMSAQVTNVVFVVDISGSMVQGKKTEKDYEELEKEVVKALRNLDPNTGFGIIAFAGKTRTFQDIMVLATPENIKAGTEWLHAQGPYGDWQKRGGHTGTAAAAALEQAIGLGPDTIFFASDGDPTDLKGDKFFEKIDSVQKAAKQKAKIFTISYKAGGQGEFMKRLAKEYHGKFREVD